MIGTLGRYWTHRIITLDTAPVVTAGPYRWLRHPNYLVVTLETLILPSAFGAFALGAIMAALQPPCSITRCKLEDAALAERRRNQSSSIAK